MVLIRLTDTKKTPRIKLGQKTNIINPKWSRSLGPPLSLTNTADPKLMSEIIKHAIVKFLNWI